MAPKGPKPHHKILGKCFDDTAIQCGYCDKKLWARSLYAHFQLCTIRAEHLDIVDAVEEKKAKHKVGVRGSRCRLSSFFDSPSVIGVGAAVTGPWQSAFGHGCF